jgi:hypothetical protein
MVGVWIFCRKSFGRTIASCTGFIVGEEEDGGITDVVPFLVEYDGLKVGVVFSKKANRQVHVVSGSLLTTSQNPASSGPAAKTLMAAVRQRTRAATARI